MARRFLTQKLMAAALSGALVVSGCAAPTGTADAPSSRAQTAPERELRQLSAAMQRTILEGALAGALAGTALGYALDSNNRSRSAGIGFTFGLGAGAAAGTYVAFLQKEYASKEDRLERVRRDLDKNNAEIATTIGVMQEVLAIQKADLDRLRARVAAGSGEDDTLKTEVAAARSNLGEMQKAIDGAVVRQAEFAQTRGLALADVNGQGVERELDVLATRISQMRAIASDLATQI